MLVDAKLLKENFPDLPVDAVLDCAQSSVRYENNTSGETIDIAATIFLTKHSDIKKLIKLAVEYEFILQPISTGKNWGYGSVSVNNQRPVVLLDLSRLNCITPISKKLGLVAVEPGVTQQQLHDYLVQNDWHFMTPVTGAGPSCSILGNALERGYGITPHTDHFGAVNKISAIIPNAQFWGKDENDFIYESGINELDGSSDKFIDHTYKWGLGAYIDGLFTQSAMGIVTSVTIRLAAKPQSFAAFYLKISDPEQLSNAVNFIQSTLRDYEGTVGSINLMDRRRLLSMVAENPNGKGSHKVMTKEQMDKLAHLYKVPEWMVVGSIYGTKCTVDAIKKDIKHHATFAKKIIFSDSLPVKIGKILGRIFPQHLLTEVRKQIKMLEEGIDIMLGKPQQVALPLAYWRNPRFEPDKSKPLNPDNDECGLLWYAPLIPMNTIKITEFVSFVRQTTPKYQIEPLITFTNLKHDCIDATIPIIFDVKNPEAKQNAKDCLDELFEEGRKRGFVPYRMNVQQQKEKLSADAMHWKVVKAIKSVMDPNDVLSPCRYNP